MNKLKVVKDNNGNLVIPNGWRKRGYQEIIEKGDLFTFKNARDYDDWSYVDSSIGQKVMNGLGESYICITPIKEEPDKFKIGDRVKVNSNYTGKLQGQKGIICGSKMIVKDRVCYPVLMDDIFYLTINDGIEVITFRDYYLSLDKEILLGSYKVEIIDNETVKVGCTTVKKSQINEILAEMEKK